MNPASDPDHAGEQKLKEESIGVAKWLMAAEEGKDVDNPYLYTLDKQKIFEGSLRWNGAQSNTRRVFVNHNRKVVTPVRQFCEIQAPPPGDRESITYQIGPMEFQDMDESEFGDVRERPSNMDADEDTKELDFERTSITCKLRPSELFPPEIKKSHVIDAMIKVNRAFVSWFVSYENWLVLNKTYNDDAATEGQTKSGGGPKNGHWVDGNTGKQITKDGDFTADKKLTVQGLRKAKEAIQEAGFGTSDLVTYVPSQSIKDILADLRRTNGSEKDLERIAGKLVMTGIDGNAQGLAKLGGNAGTNNIGYRCVMFVPNAAFRLATGRNIDMEVLQRRVVDSYTVKGTNKLGAAVNTVGATCRISCAAASPG